MKKNFLTKLNLLLGTASVALAGCHVQKNINPAPETDNTETNPPVVEPAVGPQQGQEPEPPVCLYGVPPEVYERPMRKYGVPDAAE